MTARWPVAPLGKFIKQRKEAILLKDESKYRRVTVRLHAKGIEARDEAMGRDIKTKRQFPLRADDLLVAEIDAKAGGYGIVPAKFAGAVVSSHYFIYEIDQSALSTRYLNHWLRTNSPLEQIQEFIRGALNYAAIRPYHFSKLQIPLPSLAEQERLAERLDHMAARLDEARRLNDVLDDEQQDFLAALGLRNDMTEAQKQSAGWRKVRLAEVLIEQVEPVPVQKNNKYPTIGVYSFARGVIRKPPILGAHTKAKTLYRVHAGQFIYGRLGGYEGAFAYVPSWADGACVSGEFPVFDCKPDAVLPEFLFAYFNSPEVWSTMSDACRGLAGRRIRLKESAFLAHTLWLPPLSYQQTVRDTLAQILSARALHKDLPEELDALQSALLDQAFRGEL